METEIIETIAQWIADGEWKPEFMRMDSEHSVMSAAIASEAAGARTFTASSSQGFMLMYEMLWIASGLRLPLVMVNVSRGLSAPITLWPDHNGFLATRDTGWVQIMCQNNQEVLDTIIMAYKLAEDKNVLLPVMINMEGFFLSFTREPTTIPRQSEVNKFLPKYKPSHAYMDLKKPLAQGVAVLGEYMDFRAQHHRANLNVLKSYEIVCNRFSEHFGRDHPIIDTYKTRDANTILVTMGCMSTTARAAVDKMRSRGEKVGLVRLRLLTPFPEEQLRKALQNVDVVAVIDRNIIPGHGGAVYPEVVSALYEANNQPNAYNFIAGLAKSVSMNDFELIYKKSKEYEKKNLKRAECWISVEQG